MTDPTPGARRSASATRKARCACRTVSSAPVSARRSSAYSRTGSSIRYRGSPLGPASCRIRLLSASEAIPSTRARPFAVPPEG